MRVDEVRHAEMGWGVCVCGHGEVDHQDPQAPEGAICHEHLCVCRRYRPRTL